MTDPTDYRAPIREFILNRFPGFELRDEDDIFALGFVNSLFAMELVMFVEKTFQIKVPNNEIRLDSFRTVERMGDLVVRVTSGGRAPVL
ncbi:acyl carrier protein [Streptomyces ardesiacus]|uniref:acyl carrier protein n=1 Tax=Streptomyces ardesiacus TaxID=285564 RepID=UPI003682E19B